MHEKLIKLINNILNCDVTIDSDKNNTNNWDSLNHIKIIIDIKEEFNVDIPFNDIDRLTSVKSIVTYLSKKLAK
jgi:acyl carrier protein